MIGFYVSGSVTLALGTGSIFSKNLRCSMLLVTSGLFAGRGRAMMLTLAAGFLMDGPLDSIQTNLETIRGSFVCMYNQVKQIGCIARNEQRQQVKSVSHEFLILIVVLSYLLPDEFSTSKALQKWADISYQVTDNEGIVTLTQSIQNEMDTGLAGLPSSYTSYFTIQ